MWLKNFDGCWKKEMKHKSETEGYPRQVQGGFQETYDNSNLLAMLPQSKNLISLSPRVEPWLDHMRFIT